MSAISNPPPTGEESLWDANDVAAWLKVSRSWVYRAAERGDLPCLHVGALVRFKPAAVRAWAEGTTPAKVIPLRPSSEAPSPQSES